MSDTPRTDRETFDHDSMGYTNLEKGMFVDADFARQLEREGTEYLRLLGGWKLRAEKAERELAAAGRPCDTCGGRFPALSENAECPRCFAEMEQQYAEIALAAAKQAQREAVKLLRDAYEFAKETCDNSDYMSDEETELLERIGDYLAKHKEGA